MVRLIVHGCVAAVVGVMLTREIRTGVRHVISAMERASAKPAGAAMPTMSGLDPDSIRAARRISARLHETRGDPC